MLYNTPSSHFSQRRLSLLMIAMLSFFLLSCGERKTRYKIGVSQCSEDIWRDWQNNEMRLELNFHDNVELLFATARDNSRRQSQQIDSLVNSGISLLIVAPNQLTSVSPAIDRAFDRGIPVIVFERKTDSQKYTAFVSADNYEMGHQMGEYIASRLGGKGRVMEIVGLKGSSPAIDRHKGFADAMRQHPGIEVVATLQGDWTEQSGYQAVANYQGSLNDVGFVFGQNDRMAMGARRAFIERLTPRNADVHAYDLPLPLFCGIDGLPGENGGIRQVRDQLLDASYIYPTHGDQLLQLAIDILEGRPYEKETMLTSALVTHDNANVLLLESDEVMRQSKKLGMLQEKTSTLLQQLGTQRVVFMLALGVTVLLLLLVAAIWLYQRQRMRLARERSKMEREQLDFYTQVSHKLRTPLTLIEGPLTQLADTPEMQQASPSTASTLDIVRRNTRQLTELVNQMLDVQVKQEKTVDDERLPVEPGLSSSGSVPTLATSIDAVAARGKETLPPEEAITLLIVDDNADIRTYLRSILQSRYRVLEAEDGQKGLALAREQVPDLIISDVMMPVMNGLEFCQGVKSDMLTSHVPVILLTARALSSHHVEGYESGADAYITKPFEPALLMARIENLLKSRRQLKDLWSMPLAGQPEMPSSEEADGEMAEAAVAQQKSADVESPFIKRFKAVVEQHLAESELGVEDLGQEMGLSRVQLYRKVKALTGRSPVELLRTARLSQARTLLLTTDLTISEVAYQVGFTSPSYFTKCFKDEFNVVPGDVREVRK